MKTTETAEERRRKKILTQGFIEELEGVFLGERLPGDIWNSVTKEVIVEKGQKVTKKVIRALADNYSHLDLDPSPVRIALMDRVRRYERRLSGEDPETYRRRTW